MKIIKLVVILTLCVFGTNGFARNGGDDVGNGGFAYRQSVIILKMATTALEEKIRDSQMKELVEHPERRVILQDTLGYGDLDKLSKKNRYRGTRKLAMDYTVNPSSVIVLKPYFEAFMGTTDSHLEDASLEVQKRLLHEAAHIWGYNEEKSEQFAKDFLKDFGDDDQSSDPSTQPGEEPRPTNKITIKDDFCSCKNGKSDIINNCDSFCATVPVSSEPILYLNTILDAEIAMNPRLGNLYNWCTVQLPGDATAPQCTLQADGGIEVINIPVSIKPNSNSFIANINLLSYDKTYILKLVESKTGSNAQSKEFQLRRKKQTPPSDNLGLLKVSAINQYTCINFGGEIRNNYVKRIADTFTRTYYYYPANEFASPMAPPMPGNDTLTVCHDEQLHGTADRVEFPRLENISDALSLWDKADSRLASSMGKMNIAKIIEERLQNEFPNSGITSANLFAPLKSVSRPDTANMIQGYFMLPFTDQLTGKSYCPSSDHFQGRNPLFIILGDYVLDTEGFYLAEKEGESIYSNGSYKTVYGTMFVRESVLKEYGFYIENGLKIKAHAGDLHRKSIFYYWPAHSNLDPLVSGGRKLFNVKHPGTLNGGVPEGLPTDIFTSDKRIGCVPRGIN